MSRTHVKWSAFFLGVACGASLGAFNWYFTLPFVLLCIVYNHIRD